MYAPGPGAAVRWLMPGRWELPKPGLGADIRVDRSCLPKASCAQCIQSDYGRCSHRAGTNGVQGGGTL